MTTNFRSTTACARTERLSPRRPGRWALLLLMSLPGCSGCDPRSENDASTRDAAPPAAKQAQTPSSSGESPTNPQAAPVSANPVTVERDHNAAPPEHREKKTIPSDALQQAQTLHRQALRHAQQGEVGAAYRQASQAWRLVNRFPEDTRCAKLAEKLLAEMETLGDQANQKFDAENSSQPLIVR